LRLPGRAEARARHPASGLWRVCPHATAAGRTLRVERRALLSGAAWVVSQRRGCIHSDYRESSRDGFHAARAELQRAGRPGLSRTPPAS
jgi:hypothetical protein